MPHSNEAPLPENSDAAGVAGKNFSSPPRPAGGVALEKAIQFMICLVPTLKAFPLSQKFLLGDRLQGLRLRESR